MKSGKVLVFVSLLLLSVPVKSKVRLPHLISDGMVIKQNTDVNFWGWADPGRTVKVKASWSHASLSTKADASGKWSIKIRSPKASFTPLSVTFRDDKEPVTVKDILSGEVWLCGGQSNMEMPMQGWDNCPTQGYNEEMLKAQKLGGIHYTMIPMIPSDTLYTDTKCSWSAISAATLGNVSATAYYFARTLYSALNIPVGIIVACRGGSSIEAWLSPENVAKYTSLKSEASVKEKFGNHDNQYPAWWYRGTLYPTIGYTVSGFIFYQGCTNVGSPKGTYSKLMEVLVDQWRRDFSGANLPFYFVQIAPYIYDKAENTAAALLREEQYKAWKAIPASGLVPTVDLVYPWEIYNIHPAQKEKVGERLGMLALKHNYGLSSLITEYPEYESMSVAGSNVTLKLRNMNRGFFPSGDQTGFEVAGSDKVFHAAKAWTKGKDEIIVTSTEVKAPVAVRYCFRNFQLGSVHNAAGLPLFPFRTDNW